MKVNGPELLQLRSEGWTLQRLADRYGVTKACVSLYCSRGRTRTNLVIEDVPCACGCGELVKAKRRSRLHYATQECYYAHLNARQPGEYSPWRHGQRLARRAVIDAGFPLQPTHYVHHVDRDNRNNDIGNLWVFASNAEHMSYHRGGNGCPIWCGWPSSAT